MGRATSFDCARRQGYVHVQSNYHSRFGEIDLIVQKGQELVFVEVKARSKTRFAQAIETISYSKQRKIAKTAMLFFTRSSTFPAILLPL